MRSCDTVAKCSLPCAFYGSYKMFKILASEFGTVSMCRRMQACADEFLATVTVGVVHGVYKVVIFQCIYNLDFNVAFNTLYRSYHDGYTGSHKDKRS